MNMIITSNVTIFQCQEKMEVEENESCFADRDEYVQIRFIFFRDESIFVQG